VSAVRAAVDDGLVGDRVWMYSNYHCNLACAYCLTDSSPDAARRVLPPDQMIRLAQQAAQLGFKALGVTGGEPFLAPDMPAILRELAMLLPTIVLTNGMLLSGARLDRMRPLADLPFKVQISLDAEVAEVNDSKRGTDNFRKVVENIPRLVDAGITVRVATTVDGELEPDDLERLCQLHRSLGIPDEEHVVRPIVRRGRAIEHGWGVTAGVADLFPELTITADGSFWSPFAPTVRGGRLDTDLLVTRAIEPLRLAAEPFVALASGRPPGGDAVINIR
jgi:MoaA/NifB/PqqE/SkfB family radical SAM enzyme